MEHPCTPYCASCSTRLSVDEAYADAAAHAQVHAAMTGHVVQVVDTVTWASIDTIAGEPSLPLWD